MTVTRNDLSKFRSYNYRWTFGPILASEVNDPQSYKSSGGNLPIIRTGGLPNKPVTTAIEDQLGLNLEFFIDDVTIESLVTHNPGTGPTTALTFEFTVHEPSSVGLFFQSLYIGAAQAGFNNYIEAPFVLSLDFIGWDNTGTIQKIVAKRSFVIKLTNVTFKIDSGGTVYSVTAIAHNHIAHTDEIQQIKRNITIKGDTIEEMLNSAETSLANELNRIDWSQIETIGSGGGGADSGQFAEAQNLKINGDRYKISFPVEASVSGRSLVVGAPHLASIPINASVNDIGNSPIVENLNDFATKEFAIDQSTWTGDVYKRAGNSEARVATFREGTKIVKIIETVLLGSAWGKHLQDRISQPDQHGMVDWFRIDTKVNIINTDEINKTGRPAYEFEFIVMPYKVHQSKVYSTNNPYNYAAIIAECKKAYYYSYTGKNADILDFEFSIDNGFFNPVFNIASGVDSFEANQIVEKEQTANWGGINPDFRAPPGAITKRTEHAAKEIVTVGGLGTSVTKDRIAHLFNDRILNSHVDNIELNLKILGDPYYLSDNDAGNYRSPQESLYVNTDGTIDYLRSEVDIIVQFNSGIDYSKNTGLMILDPVNGFNGVYRIITVSSNFSKGQFTQELKLLRRPNQTSESVSLSNTVASAYAANLNIDAVNEILAEAVSSVSQILNPIISLLPQELQLFDMSKLQIDLISQLGDTAIYQALNSVDTFVNGFQTMGTNLLNTIPGLNVPLSGITSSLSGIQSSLNSITNGNFANLSSGIQGLSSGLTNISSAVQSFQSSIHQVPRQIQSSISQIGNTFRL